LLLLSKLFSEYLEKYYTNVFPPLVMAFKEEQAVEDKRNKKESRDREEEADRG
jgi:hypothetical protein